MTQRLDRVTATTADVMRILPFAGPPAHMSPGEIPAGLATTQPLAGPRFEHMVERLHRLGSRVLGELLFEIATATSEPGLISDCVEAYAGLDPVIVRALGADRFPPSVLCAVGQNDEAAE